MLSGVSWDSPVPVALVNWFAWDLLLLFEAVVEITQQAPDATVALPEPVDAVFSSCPAVIAVPPTIDDYVSLPPEAAAMTCACLFYQASWSRQLSAGIEAGGRYLTPGFACRARPIWRAADPACNVAFL